MPTLRRHPMQMLAPCRRLVGMLIFAAGSLVMLYGLEKSLALG